MNQKHPELPDDSPFAHPNAWEDWKLRKATTNFDYDILIFAKTAEAAMERLMVDYELERCLVLRPSGYPLFRIKDGRFVVLTPDMVNIREVHPRTEIWNWWDEGSPDLATLREKRHIDQLISSIRQ